MVTLKINDNLVDVINAKIQSDKRLLLPSEESCTVIDLYCPCCHSWVGTVIGKDIGESVYEVVRSQLSSSFRELDGACYSCRNRLSRIVDRYKNR